MVQSFGYKSNPPKLNSIASLNNLPPSIVGRGQFLDSVFYAILFFFLVVLNAYTVEDKNGEGFPFEMEDVALALIPEE